MMKRLLFFIGGTIILSAAFGQSKDYNKEQKNIFLDADSYYVYGDFSTAVSFFKLIENVDPNFNEVDYKIGYSYYKLKKYQEAIPYLEKGIPFDFEALFYLTEIYLRQENFKKADESMELYETYWDEMISKHSSEDIKRLKGQIKRAQEMMSMPQNVKILNVGGSVNSDAHEYVPLIDGDESQLIFTTKRLSEQNGYAPNGLPFEDVYVSYRGKDGTWENATRIKGAINTESNDAGVGLSADGEHLFLFRPNENLYSGDIYESKLENGEWTTPVLLDDHINAYNSIEASATISLDGNTIYFSSNREGGYGGFDIYRVVKLPNGEWSWPKNLGPEINTAKNDDSPFLHPNGKTLYFSSQAHDNMGGYDIFYSELDDLGYWSKPTNLGYPINTTADDIHYVISTNEQHGYYSSEKPDGYGGQDIYMIDYLEKKLRQSIIRGRVINMEGQAIESDVSLINKETRDIEGIYKPRLADGKFVFLVNPDVEYELIIEYGNGQEYVESISYSIEDLMIPQTKSIQVK